MAVVARYPMAADLGGLTDHDRAIVEVEMFHRKLLFNNDGLVEFPFSLWKDLEYVEGAKRVESNLTEMARIKLEEQSRQELAKQAQAKRDQEEASRRAAVDTAAKQHADEIKHSTPVRRPASKRRRLKAQG